MAGEGARGHENVPGSVLGTKHLHHLGTVWGEKEVRLSHRSHYLLQRKGTTWVLPGFSAKTPGVDHQPCWAPNHTGLPGTGRDPVLLHMSVQGFSHPRKSQPQTTGPAEATQELRNKVTKLLGADLVGGCPCGALAAGGGLLGHGRDLRRRVVPRGTCGTITVKYRKPSGVPDPLWAPTPPRTRWLLA